MKVSVERDRLIIEPETPQDIAFIEDTLLLDVGGTAIRLVRHDASSTKSTWPFKLIGIKERRS